MITITIQIHEQPGRQLKFILDPLRHGATALEIHFQEAITEAFKKAALEQGRGANQTTMVEWEKKRGRMS